MTLTLKPGWNAATLALTGLALVIEWPLALGVAAYAAWGDRLTGIPRHDSLPLASFGAWLSGRPAQSVAVNPGPAETAKADSAEERAQFEAV